MNDEKTIYDNEKKEYQSQKQKAKQNEEKTEPIVDDKRVPVKKPLWQRAAVGAGTGFAAGVAATVLTSGTTSGQALQQEQVDGNDGTGEAATSHPAWTDGEVNIATSVNDGMSFGEAFAAARSEVGAGGAFEWRGGIYGTYYEDEWSSMSAAERAEYGSHFNWNEHHNDYAAIQHQGNASANEVAATVVDQAGSDEITATIVDQPTDDEVVPVEVANVEDNPEVEILGVVHDDASGANIGGMMIDGHEAVMLDVNGDMTFDILGVDLNDNHEFEESEQMDISEHGITVDDFNAQAETGIEQASLDTAVDDAGTYDL